MARRLTTNQEIAGSIPASIKLWAPEVHTFGHLARPSTKGCQCPCTQCQAVASICFWLESLPGVSLNRRIANPFVRSWSLTYLDRVEALLGYVFVFVVATVHGVRVSRRVRLGHLCLHRSIISTYFPYRDMVVCEKNLASKLYLYIYTVCTRICVIVARESTRKVDQINKNTYNALM
jgi:hypothetical protein